MDLRFAELFVFLFSQAQFTVTKEFFVTNWKALSSVHDVWADIRRAGMRARSNTTQWLIFLRRCIMYWCQC
jgi:hypothetical protein